MFEACWHRTNWRFLSRKKRNEEQIFAVGYGPVRRGRARCGGGGRGARGGGGGRRTHSRWPIGLAEGACSHRRGIASPHAQIPHGAYRGSGEERPGGAG